MSQGPSPNPPDTNKPAKKPRSRAGSLLQSPSHINVHAVPPKLQVEPHNEAEEGEEEAEEVRTPRIPLTPEIANSNWAAQQQSFLYSQDTGNSFRGLRRTSSQSGRVSSSGLRTPSGFEHLDFGADYFGSAATAAHSQQPEKRVPRSFEWEAWGRDDAAAASGTSSSTLAPPPPATAQPGEVQVLKRRLSPNEVSYYLGSRGEGPRDPLSGVNDMYLHVAFKAPPFLVTPDRVLDIWTELRLRHPLLASCVEFKGFEDIHFAYLPPSTYQAARAHAETAFGYKTNTTKDQVLDAYLNGPRTLSDQRLSAFFISTEGDPQAARLNGLSLSEPHHNGDAAEEDEEFNLYLCATHFIGDGMALHSAVNEFLLLLHGQFEELKESQSLRWDHSERINLPVMQEMPPATEERLNTPQSYGRMAWAAARVEFQRNQSQLIGGHSFPRAKKGTRQTVVPTKAYSKEDTKRILGACKSQGTTIAHAFFALANIAHMKVTARAADSDPWAAGKKKDLPTMLYSALNLRPHLSKGPGEAEGISQDFFHLAIGYYNIVLPSFQPKELSLAQTFWLRTKETKEQTIKAAKSPWLLQRSKLMYLERERRSIGFEKQDEARRKAKVEAAKTEGSKGLGIGLGPPPEAAQAVNGSGSEAKPKPKPAPALSVPSVALLGVSMLGNLDALYSHVMFPKFKICGLTTGSRQRPGAMLLFAYTLCGQLYVSLGYDENSYADGVVEAFYGAMFEGIEEFLLPTAPA